MIGFDTETTGTDFLHGCRPFFVSTCTDKGVIQTWEWDVDPMTREPIVPVTDKEEIRQLLYDARKVGHNSKFDVRALVSIGIDVIGSPNHIPAYSLKGWDRVQDTLIASHVLASDESHKLKDLALQYLDIGDDDQSELQVASKAARKVGDNLGWRTAAPEDPHFPAVRRAPKVGWWVYDTWLPKAVCKACQTNRGINKKLGDEYGPDHPWNTVLATYATLDAERTIGLWYIFQEALEDEGLWEVYKTKLKTMGATFVMESNGMSISTRRLNRKQGQYRKECIEARNMCYSYGGAGVDGTTLNSPKQLQGLIFGTFRLKPVKSTKTGFSTDADSLTQIQTQVPSTSYSYQFIKHLLRSRKLAKAVDYLEGYEAFSVPAGHDGNWIRIYPSFNTTGTKTTRLSSHDPNAQNISKGEFNLRDVFGPLPGRVWYALDYENIEKRIPAWLADETELIDLFNSGGSYHLLVGETVRPELFKRLGPDEFKKTQEYRWIKNGNFAEQYGGGEATVDKAFRVPGGYKLVKGRFKKIAKLARQVYKDAARDGFITTIGGYRLQCPRYDDGRVEYTKPFNYFIQGTAGWVMGLALVRVAEYIERLGPDYKLIMTIHDELVLDFPISRSNIPKVRRVKALMEQGGDDIGIPCPVDCDVITTTWARGTSLAI